VVRTSLASLQASQRRVYISSSHTSTHGGSSIERHALEFLPIRKARACNRKIDSNKQSQQQKERERALVNRTTEPATESASRQCRQITLEKPSFLAEKRKRKRRRKRSNSL
jgi:hypothetical protein